MMKRFFILVLAFYSTISCSFNFEKSSGKQKNDLQYLNLKGKIKSIIETPYKAVFEMGEVKKKEMLFFSDNQFFMSRVFYSVLHIPAEEGYQYGELGVFR